MSCLFEPLHGRLPTNSICDSYPDCVGCSYSDPFKQPKQTNADRIRNMNDEELAEFLGSHGCFDCTKECEEVHCDACWLEWLKEETP